MKRRACGLTLLELMVTLAIASALLFVGIPAYGRTVEQVRTMSTFNTATTALALARSLAITRRVPAAVCPSFDGLRCRLDGVWDAGWIVFLDPERIGQPSRPDAVLRRFDPLPTRFHLHATQGRPLVRYQASGSAAGTNLTLRLCTEEALLGSVVMNNPGRSRTVREKGRPACPYSAD